MRIHTPSNTRDRSITYTACKDEFRRKPSISQILECIFIFVISYTCTYINHFRFAYVFFPGVFFHSRVTGTCPATTDFIMRIIVRTTTMCTHVECWVEDGRKTPQKITTDTHKQAVCANSRLLVGCPVRRATRATRTHV